jgi:hypothetical protein
MRSFCRLEKWLLALLVSLPVIALYPLVATLRSGLAVFVGPAPVRFFSWLGNFQQYPFCTVHRSI